MNILPQKFCFCIDLRKGIVWLAWFMMLLNIPLIILMFIIIAQRNKIFVDHPKLENALIPVCIVETGGAFIQIFTNIFLIYGVVKKSHRDMLPWLVINKVTLALLVATIIMIGMQIGSQLPLGIYIIMAFTAGILIYFWLCVFSLFKTYKTFSSDDPMPVDDLERILIDDDDDDMLQ